MPTFNIHMYKQFYISFKIILSKRLNKLKANKNITKQKAYFAMNQFSVNG